MLTIKSGEPITDETLAKIKDIFRESKCPNESLSKTFDNFSWFKDKIIQFGEGENFVEYISVAVSC
ncbi:MAG: hypothetical protein IJG24_02015 [Selenomonadaceae bacterium]|nr:hypothetical protein [Selenomonadaceae bacterium]